MPADASFTTSWALPPRRRGCLSSAILDHFRNALRARWRQRQMGSLVDYLDDHLRSDIGLPPQGRREMHNLDFPRL